MRDNEMPPTVRWATTLDLDAVEARLTKKIEERSRLGWQITTILIVIASAIPSYLMLMETKP